MFDRLLFLEWLMSSSHDVTSWFRLWSHTVPVFDENAVMFHKSHSGQEVESSTYNCNITDVICYETLQIGARLRAVRLERIKVYKQAVMQHNRDQLLFETHTNWMPAAVTSKRKKTMVLLIGVPAIKQRVNEDPIWDQYKATWWLSDGTLQS